MRYYVGLIHKDLDSEFGISFPDFPGCISAGATLREAADMGAEALAAHMELMIDEGLVIPEPSQMDEIVNDPGHRDGVPVMVPVGVQVSGRPVRASVTMPEDFLAQVDAFAERKGMSRSGFLVQAARNLMESA